jgi:hypothetical protein
MIGKLIWKEWSEHRWKLFLGFLLLGGFTAIGLQARVVQDLEVVVWALVYAVIFPLFVSMDLLAAERADGTLRSLLNLPVAAWKILAVKVGVGLVVCVGPLILTAVVALCLAGGRESDNERMWGVYQGSCCLAACLLIWMLAFGVRQPTEGRAAVAGMIAFGVLLVPGFIYAPLRHVLPEWIIILHPVSLLMIFVNPVERHWAFAAIPIQTAFAAGLFWWSARRLNMERRAA